MNEILTAALAWQQNGFAVLPIHTEDTARENPSHWKTPVGRWRETPALTADDVVRWWDNDKPPGLGLRMGVLTDGSGDTAEMAEVEGRARTRLTEVAAWLDAHGAADLWRRLWLEGYVEESPSGGVHFIYRIAGGIPEGEKSGNAKLARDSTRETLAETRGEGGFVAIAPSPGYCHPSGSPWRALTDSTAGVVLTLTLAERGLLLDALRSLDEQPARVSVSPGERAPARQRAAGDPLRPGDDYNARADWTSELEEAGWTYAGRQAHPEGGADVELWRRPGKGSDEGHSATLGFARSEAGEPMLYVFSSSADLPEEYLETALTPFAWYAATHHQDESVPGGVHWAEAASALASLGYGDPLERTTGADEQYEDGEWPRRAWSDLGNAARMSDRYDGRLLWVPESGWAVYGDGVWHLDAPEHALQLAQQMVLSLPRTEAMSYDEEPPAPEVDDDGNVIKRRGRPRDEDVLSERDRFEKWARQQQAMQRVEACLRAAKGLPTLRASVGEFDSQATAMLLNVRNGVINLRTGELLAHSPEFMFTARVEVDYDAHAKAPEFEAFLERMQPDIENRAYLQRVMGYTLSASVQEQAFFIHYGAQGANGKSVYADTFAALFGDLYTKLAREYVLERRGGGEPHPTGLAALKGARFIVVSETGRGQRMSQDRMRELSGDGNVQARFMNRDYFSFMVTGKVHYVTNHLPQLSDESATWRRVHVIEWPVTLKPNEWDKTLRERIVDHELSGVLAWAVRGCLLWQELGGLGAPLSAQELVNSYREESDVFGDFVSEVLIAEEGAQTLTRDLYEVYAAWCDRLGFNAMSSKALGQAMRERGFPPFRTNTTRGYSGCTIRSGAVIPKRY